jgi:methyl-accepting chemotaxis protein
MVTQFGTGTGVGADGAAAARAAVEQAADGLGDRDPEFAVVFASSVYDYQAVVETVREATGEATLIGASSAGEFTEDGAASESVTVSLIASDEMRFHVGIGEGVTDDIEGAVERAAAEFPKRDDAYPHRVGINLHDGLVGRGEEIAMLAYQAVPMGYAGGSAADDRNLEETVVFADDHTTADAVALAMIESKRPFAQSVDHGHEAVAGGFEVTAADGSVVEELDGRPAYEVWAEAVDEQIDIDVGTVTPDDGTFGELLTRFEFGIKTGDDEYKVRWPGLTPTTDGPLHFATKVAEGTELFLMDSDIEAQMTTAGSVTDDAVADGGEQFDPAGALAFDCICQGNILGDRFGDAVDRMAAELGAPLAGMQTYGEIGMKEGDMRAYHNTTSSLLVFPE